MTSVLYVCLCALLLIQLSWNVIQLRRSKLVSLGDNNDKELRKAIGAMENASEYMPVTLLMLMALEYNSAPAWLVHFLGILFIIARLLHAHGIRHRFQWRVLGMQLTFAVMLGLVISNAVFLPYEKLF